MKIILLRHASRSMSAFADAPLSPVGQRQAAQLAHQVLTPSVSQQALPRPTQLFCSPKTRAKSTLTPLAEATGIRLTIDERFDERLNDEAASAFEARTLQVLEELAARLQTSDCAYICSHLDWLEVALRVLPTDLSDKIDPANWSNCEYRVFDVQGGLWSAIANGIITASPTKEQS